MAGYNAKHMRPKANGEAKGPMDRGGDPRPRHMGSTSLRLSWVLLGMVLVVSIAGGTLAWFAQTEGVTNIFTSGSVKPEIEETFNTGYTVKQDVKVKNTGTMSAYLRASVAVYWFDTEGNQLWDAPVLDTDYSIAWNIETPDAVAGGQWLKGSDGFYYWSKPVAKEASTGVLINNASQIGTPTGGKRLVVDIASQALQAEGGAQYAFDDAWGGSGLVVGADGTLERKGA